MRRPRELLRSGLGCAFAAAFALALAQCSGGGDGGDPGDGSPGGEASSANESGTDGSGDGAGTNDGADSGACPPAVQVSPVSDTPAAQLVIKEDPGSVAIADPSIFYPPGAPGGALSFSSLAAAPGGGPDQGAISTHVAVSSDHGATWVYAAAANTVVSTTPPPHRC